MGYAAGISQFLLPPTFRPGHHCKFLDGVVGDLNQSSAPQKYNFRHEED